MATKPDLYVYVYIIGPAQGPVKVGISHSPDGRRAQLQAKSNERLTLMGAWPVGKARALAVEHYAHWLLRKRSVGSEWFDVSQETAAQAIKDAIDTDVHPDYPMLPISYYPRELSGGTYMRTKFAPGVADRIRAASSGHHSAFIREAVEAELQRREKEGNDA